MRYAVKIGEIRITSDKPITDEQRKWVCKHIEGLGDTWLKFNDGLEVVVNLPQP